MTRFSPTWLLALLAPFCGLSRAQDTNLPSAATSAVSQLNLGTAAIDPANEFVAWNGRTWQITNNRIFESQFDLYLNAPAADPATVAEYERILADIRNLLSPGKVSPASIDKAFSQLRVASEYEIDGNISDVLSGQVYSTWLSQRDRSRMQSAMQTLQAERSRLEWNLKMTAQGTGLKQTPAGKPNEMATAAARRTTETVEMQPIATRLLEVETLLKKNDAGREMAASQARVDFQVLIVQLFLQRRFDHIPIAIDFYRSLFDEGASQVRLGDEAMSLFSRTTGGAPTLATLDSAAREMSNQTRQGIKAFETMLANRQIQSAARRLSEAYLIGQNLPSMDLVPLPAKQEVLAFLQKVNRLTGAIEVRDYAQAESLLASLQSTSLDFDPTKPNAAIQTGKLAAEMHLAKARNAAVAGDKTTLESELKAAAEIWPTNPQLRELSAKIFTQADVGAQALSDFDQLLNQKNFRRIYEEKMRFIAATAMDPARQESLRKVLDDITEIEMAIQRATEIEKQGNAAGAWEAIETAARSAGSDPKLSQTRANLTVRAAAFVDLIQNAEKFEQRRQLALALTAYLAAQQLYPLSTFAKDGILRIISELYPDSR